MKDEITRDWQRDLVVCTTRGLTTEQIDAITDKCMSARERGDNAGVWHQVVLYFGTPCRCVQCSNRKDNLK